jgi:NADH dehydrogenase FAD-containing subunit
MVIDRGKRILGTFTEGLSDAAMKRLGRLGVEVRFGVGVASIDADGVTVAGERILSKVVIWTAGVAPSPAGKWLNAKD